MTENDLIEKAWQVVQDSPIWANRTPTPHEVTVIAISALPIPLSDLLAAVNGESVIVPKATLVWWSRLASANPSDLPPRISAMIEARPK